MRAKCDHIHSVFGPEPCTYSILDKGYLLLLCCHFKKSRFVCHQMHFLLLPSCLDEALKPGIALLDAFHSPPHFSVLMISQTSLTTRLLLEERPDNGHN